MTSTQVVSFILLSVVSFSFIRFLLEYFHFCTISNVYLCLLILFVLFFSQLGGDERVKRGGSSYKERLSWESSRE